MNRITKLQLLDCAKTLQESKYLNADGNFDIERALTSNDETIKSAIDTIEKAGYKINSSLSIDLIVAMNALYRPGPMDYIGDYIKGRLHPENIVYDCPEIKPILEPTFGVIVYQEQVMQIVRDLAGYSWGRSDLMRRAMSKKKQEVIEEERKNFVYGNEELNVPGCVKNGISEEIANKIYDKMVAFAKYAFNKSHAAAYSVTSFITGYCKEYFPAEYLCNVMNYAEKVDEISEIIEDARDFGIKIMPPDINKSDINFSVVNNIIYYGLNNIKGVSIDAAKRIMETRPYSSFNDFLLRGHVDSGSTKSLIESGAFDTFVDNRSSLFAENEWMQDLFNLVSDINKKQKYNDAAKRVSEFVEEYDSLNDLRDRIEEEGISYPIKLKKYPTKDSIIIKIRNSEKKIKSDIEEMNLINLNDFKDVDFSMTEILRREKDVLGLYLTAHPIDEFQVATIPISDITIDITNNQSSFGCVSGIISEVKTRKDRNGKQMATFKISDKGGVMSCICFASNYENIKYLIKDNAAVKLTGKLIYDEYNSDSENEVYTLQVKKANALKRKVVIYQATLSIPEFYEAYADIISYQSDDGYALIILDKVTGLTRKTSFNVSREIINLPYVKKIA